MQVTDALFKATYGESKSSQYVFKDESVVKREREGEGDGERVVSSIYSRVKFFIPF